MAQLYKMQSVKPRLVSQCLWSKILFRPSSINQRAKDPEDLRCEDFSQDDLERVFGPQTHGSGRMMWKIFSAMTIPLMSFLAFNAYIHKQEETAEEKGRPEFVPYEYLRIRKKKFPWGDGNHTLFHNPKVNPLPEGYEDE